MEYPLHSGEPIDNEDRTPLMLDRRGRIADLVRQHGSMRVNELAEIFQVSSVTIRSDLAQLEREGHLLRDHGGAVANQISSALIAFDQRAGIALEQKRRIGEAAARFVAPGDTLLMDCGTTVVEMVRPMRQISPLTVVTNALNVAAELRSLHDCNVVLLGGTLNYATFGTLGPMVEQSLGDMTIQKLFLAAESLDPAFGVTDSTLEIAQVKRAMVRAARQVILMVDSSKWRRSGFIKVIPFTAVHTLITDDGISDVARRAVEQAGTQLIVV